MRLRCAGSFITTSPGTVAGSYRGDGGHTTLARPRPASQPCGASGRNRLLTRAGAQAIGRRSAPGRVQKSEHASVRAPSRTPLVREVARTKPDLRVQAREPPSLRPLVEVLPQRPTVALLIDRLAGSDLEAYRLLDRLCAAQVVRIE